MNWRKSRCIKKGKSLGPSQNLEWYLHWCV